MYAGGSEHDRIGELQPVRAPQTDSLVRDDGAPALPLAIRLGGHDPLHGRRASLGACALRGPAPTHREIGMK